MKIQIRFAKADPPNGDEFVEVEDEHGKSISIGEWQDDGRYRLLVLDPCSPPEGVQARTIEEAKRERDEFWRKRQEVWRESSRRVLAEERAKCRAERDAQVKRMLHKLYKAHPDVFGEEALSYVYSYLGFDPNELEEE